jgi:hypothetical protein
MDCGLRFGAKGSKPLAPNLKIYKKNGILQAIYDNKECP